MSHRVHIKVIGCDDLQYGDAPLNDKNLFLTLQLTNQEDVYKTETISNNANPKWNEEFDLETNDYMNESIEFHLMSEQESGEDVSLVEPFQIDCKDIEVGGAISGLNAEIIYEGETVGVIHLEISSFDLNADENAANKQDLSKPILLRCKISKAVGVTTTEVGASNDTIILTKIKSHDDSEAVKSIVNEPSSNPTWNQVFSIICNDPMNDILVFNMESGGKVLMKNLETPINKVNGFRCQQEYSYTSGDGSGGHFIVEYESLILESISANPADVALKLQSFSNMNLNFADNAEKDIKVTVEITEEQRYTSKKKIVVTETTVNESIVWNESCRFVSNEPISDDLRINVYGNGEKVIDELKFPVRDIKATPEPMEYVIPVTRGGEPAGSLAFLLQASGAFLLKQEASCPVKITATTIETQYAKACYVTLRLKSDVKKTTIRAPIDQDIVLNSDEPTNDSIFVGFWDEETNEKLNEEAEIEISSISVNSEAMFENKVSIGSEVAGFYKVKLIVVENKEAESKTKKKVAAKRSLLDETTGEDAIAERDADIALDLETEDRKLKEKKQKEEEEEEKKKKEKEQEEAKKKKEEEEEKKKKQKEEEEKLKQKEEDEKKQKEEEEKKKKEKEEEEEKLKQKEEDEKKQKQEDEDKKKKEKDEEKEKLKQKEEEEKLKQKEEAEKKQKEEEDKKKKEKEEEEEKLKQKEEDEKKKKEKDEEDEKKLKEDEKKKKKEDRDKKKKEKEEKKQKQEEEDKDKKKKQEEEEAEKLKKQKEEEESKQNTKAEDADKDNKKEKKSHHKDKKSHHKDKDKKKSGKDKGKDKNDDIAVQDRDISLEPNTDDQKAESSSSDSGKHKHKHHHNNNDTANDDKNHEHDHDKEHCIFSFGSYGSTFSTSFSGYTNCSHSLSSTIHTSEVSWHIHESIDDNGQKPTRVESLSGEIEAVELRIPTAEANYSLEEGDEFYTTICHYGRSARNSTKSDVLQSKATKATDSGDGKKFSVGYKLEFSKVKKGDYFDVFVYRKKDKKKIGGVQIYLEKLSINEEVKQDFLIKQTCRSKEPSGKVSVRIFHKVEFQ